MVPGFRLLILSPPDGYRQILSLLATRLSDSGITVSIHSPESLPDSHPVLVMDDNFPLTGRDVLRFTSEYTGNAVTKGIEILRLYRNQQLVWQSELSRFRNQQEREIHTTHILVKALKQCLLHPEDVYLAEYSAPVSKSIPAAASNKLIRSVQRDNWVCAIANEPIHEIALFGSKVSVSDIYPPDPDNLRADPFGITINGEEIIFYEKQHRNSKGVIAIKRYGNEHGVLESPFHSSYPFLLEDSGKYFCIPEQQASGRTDLYEFIPDEQKMVFRKTILENFAAGDPTILRKDHLFWLFGTDAVEQGANSRLHLFYSESLEGPWKPHSLNPVKISVFGARPAGTIFRHEGNYYRPGQDSTKEYGGAINIYRIDVLNAGEYRETLVNRILPSQFGEGFSGVHTLSAMGNKTLVDLKEKIFTFRNLLPFRRNNE